MAQSNVEVDPIFTCMICRDYPKDPVNCPQCTQFVCTHCIDVWCRSSVHNGIVTCPTCRKVTRRDEFIKLVWLEEHLKGFNEQRKEFEQTKLNKCSQHAKQELCIYCSTCSKPICAQCISSLFNGEHIDHTHFRLDAAQQRLLKAFDKQEKHVQSDDLDQLHRRIKNKKSMIDQTQMRMRERLSEVAQFRTQIDTQIMSEATKSLNKLNGELSILIEERTTYKKRCATLKEFIESSNQFELFEKEKELSQQILQRAKIPTTDEVDLADDMIGSPLALPWQTGEFVITDFSNKRQNTERISSPPILLDHNQHWTLIIYANGIGFNTGVDLGIMLELSKGMPQSIDYNVRMQLIHHRYDDSRHNYIAQSTQSFKEGQSNDYIYFYKLNNLFTDGFVNPKTDSIKFRFKLSPKSIFEERKLLQWQIESINEIERNRDEENKQMKQIQDELIRSGRDYRETKRIIKDQRCQIEDLERNNSELKRKRTQSDNGLINQEDPRSHSNHASTAIFNNEKRFKK